MKSRELHLPDLFKLLQLEWITYKVRQNIYQRGCDLKKFNDILKMKEEKIDKFALRNSIPSIFSSKNKMEKYLEMFYPINSVPDFQYTPKNKESYLMFDRLFFFKQNTHVTYKEQNCQIQYNDCTKCELVLKLESGEFKKVPYSEVRKDISYIFK